MSGTAALPGARRRAGADAMARRWRSGLAAAGIPLLQAALLMACIQPAAIAASLPDLVERIRPGVVGVGSHRPLGAPQNLLGGTGFVVGDGLTVVTNAHVADRKWDTAQNERLVVFVGRGQDASVRPATLLKSDRRHDVAVLRIEGPPVPTLRLGTDEFAREGQSIAFTGFPIGSVLGLYPATHVGIVAAIVPLAIPQTQARSLSAAQIKRLRDPYDVYQLDATAYPGNSGSPLYDATSGEVIGIISSVLVKDAKENVLKDPSAITYAIPVRHLHQLLRSIDP